MTVRALQHWILWDIESALLDIEECAIQAPLSFNPQADNVVLSAAAAVAVQLVGLQLWSVVQVPSGWQYVDRLVGEDYEDKKQKFTRIVKYAEILLKLMKCSACPWGRFLEEFISATFTNFMAKSQQKIEKNEQI